MKKYNLTFWQRLELIPLFFYWLLAPLEKRKSWHEVKKGIEKHICHFKKPYYVQGYKFYMCDHKGCTVCDEEPSI